MIRMGEYLDVGEGICMNCLTCPCVCTMMYLEMKISALRGEISEEILPTIIFVSR